MASYSKGLIILNSSAKCKLWFEYSGILKESFSAVVMQNIEKVFNLFSRIIHVDFRSSHSEPSTSKRLLWISFLMETAFLRTAFLHYTSRYVSVWVKQKNSKTFKIFCYLWVAASKTSEMFGIPDASL